MIVWLLWIILQPGAEPQIVGEMSNQGTCAIVARQLTEHPQNANTAFGCSQATRV